MSVCLGVSVFSLSPMDSREVSWTFQYSCFSCKGFMIHPWDSFPKEINVFLGRSIHVYDNSVLLIQNEMFELHIMHFMGLYQVIIWFVNIWFFHCLQASFQNWDNKQDISFRWDNDYICNAYHCSVFQLYFRRFRWQEIQNGNLTLRFWYDRRQFRVWGYDFLFDQKYPFITTLSRRAS